MQDPEGNLLAFGMNQGELPFPDDKKTRITYLKGETLFKQGAFAPYVMYIIDGLVRIYLQVGYNKQINLRIGRSGDFLAFSSVFGENIYTYSGIALRDSVVCMIDKIALKDYLVSNPEFALKVTSRNFRNESHLLEIIKNISYKQMRGKLASALLYLSDEDFAQEQIFRYLTRQDLADFASVSEESAIRFIKEFEKEGVLVLDGKDIIVSDREKLEDISRKG
jgi:CRP/FNR family transcriptional regulator